jgi:hypothetical protein
LFLLGDPRANRWYQLVPGSMPEQCRRLHSVLKKIQYSLGGQVVEMLE